MIHNLVVTGVHMDIGDDLKKYINRKIGRLDRYISQSTQGAMSAEVRLTAGVARRKDDRTCEVIVRLPKETITVHEATINIFAAVDIVEAKLKVALKKYKMLYDNPRLHQRLLRRLKHRVSEA